MRSPQPLSLFVFVAIALPSSGVKVGLKAIALHSKASLVTSGAKGSFEESCWNASPPLDNCLNIATLSGGLRDL